MLFVKEDTFLKIFGFGPEMTPLMTFDPKSVYTP